MTAAAAAAASDDGDYISQRFATASICATHVSRDRMWQVALLLAQGCSVGVADSRGDTVTDIGNAAAAAAAAATAAHMAV